MVQASCDFQANDDWRNQAHLVDMLEALYDVQQPRSAWFRGVLRVAGAAFDRGAGVGLALYDVSGAQPRVEAMDGVNVDARNMEIGAAVHSEPWLSKAIVESYRNSVCATMAEHVPDAHMLEFVRARYAEVGLSDQILLNGVNKHTGLGCALFVFSRTRIHLPASVRTLMRRIATHLAAAYRLQHRLEHQATTTAGADAVLRADGRIEHVEPVASSRVTRLVLSEAVRLREWAKTVRGRRDPLRATAGWKPLVDARWSLIDSYERNGLRYITARENSPVPTGLPTLSRRERQVSALAEAGHSNKLIAYELGLAHSTVRVLLARAATKMGARTRAELIDRLQLDGARMLSGPA